MENEQGLKAIGNYLPSKENSQKKEAYQTGPLTTKKNSSELTGSTPLPPKLRNLIGQLLGGHGLSIANDLETTYTRPITEPPAARATRSMISLLKQQPESLKNAQNVAEISKALDVLGGGTRSERETRIAFRITTLLAHYPQASKNDAILEAVTNDWLEILGQYPYFAVDAACQHWLVNPSSDFRPGVDKIAALAKMYARLWLEVKEMIKENDQ